METRIGQYKPYKLQAISRLVLTLFWPNCRLADNYRVLFQSSIKTLHNRDEVRYVVRKNVANGFPARKFIA